MAGTTSKALLASMAGLAVLAGGAATTVATVTPAAASAIVSRPGHTTPPTSLQPAGSLTRPGGPLKAQEVRRHFRPVVVQKGTTEQVRRHFRPVVVEQIRRHFGPPPAVSSKQQSI